MLDPGWLERGFFELKSRELRKNSFSQQVRSLLSERLHAAPMQVGSYPVGPIHRHTLWWRDDDVDYAEAQYFISIDRDHPVLSLGVSVEKGFEDPSPRARGSKRMNRRSWDWQRLTRRAQRIFETELPALSRELRRPIFGWVEDRTFVTGGAQWSERHRGRADVPEILAHIKELDGHHDAWVNVYFGCDLSLQEAQGLSAFAVVDLLVAFRGLRALLKG